jgi:hypothetical protein
MIKYRHEHNINKLSRNKGVIKKMINDDKH